MEEIKGKVINYSDIPERLTEDSWLNDYSPNCYVMCHVDTDEELDELDNWFINEYPGIQEEEYFFIKIDN